MVRRVVSKYELSFALAVLTGHSVLLRHVLALQAFLLRLHVFIILPIGLLLLFPLLILLSGVLSCFLAFALFLLRQNNFLVFLLLLQEDLDLDEVLNDAEVVEPVGTIEVESVLVSLLDVVPVVVQGLLRRRLDVLLPTPVLDCL